MAQKIRLAKEPSTVGMVARGSWRFVTGAPLIDGEPRTDATWTHKGTKSYGHRRASWWSYQTKTLRVGARMSGAGAAVAATYGAAVDPETTATAVHHGAVGVGSLAAAAIGYKATDAALHWRHAFDWVWPLHVVLAEALALPQGTRPRHYLHVPRDFNERVEQARVELPPHVVLSADVRQRVQAALTEKLALQDVTFSWQTTGRDHYVVAKATPRPPRVVAFSDPEVRKKVENAAEDAPLIGMSHSGRMVNVSLDTESPHILVAMSTGGGKSVLLQTMAAQFLHNGAEVVVLDFKRHSHKWIVGIPGVRYCRDIGEIHDTLIELAGEGDERNRIIEGWEGDPKDAPVGPRKVVLFEEANATIAKLKSYWKKIKSKDDQAESPALEAYGDLLFMGRAVKMHVLLVAQSGTANALGGPEKRECFGTRILARYTKNAWNMLVPEAGAAPRKINHTGRCQVVINGTSPKETQVLFFQPDEAREWALAGTVPTTAAPRPATRAPLPDPAPAAPQVEPSHTHAHAGSHSPHTGETPAEPHTGEAVSEPDGAPYPPLRVIPGEGQGGGPSSERAPRVPDPAPAPESAPEKAPEIELVNMSQASQDKGRAIIPMNADAIRQARRSDPEFPAPDGKVRGVDGWKPETLQRWHRNRPRATGSL